MAVEARRPRDRCRWSGWRRSCDSRSANPTRTAPWRPPQRLGLPPAFELDAAASRPGRAPRERAWRRTAISSLAALASARPAARRMLDRREETAVIEAALTLRAPGRYAPTRPAVRDRPGLDAASALRRTPDRSDRRRARRPGRRAVASRSARRAPRDHRRGSAGRGRHAGPRPRAQGLAAARDAVLDGRVGPAERDAQLRVALDAAC